MPLPDAEPGQKSNLYAQLRSSQLDSVTQDNFDKVKNPVFINREWEDEARRLKLWGEIAGRSSSAGPMPGTFQVVEVGLTEATTYTAFECPQDEVWQIVAAGCEAFATNQTYVILKLKDNTSGKSVRIDSLSAGYTEYNLNEPIFIGGSSGGTSEILIQGGATGTWSGTNTNQVALIRVR